MDDVPFNFLKARLGWPSANAVAAVLEAHRRMHRLNSCWQGQLAQRHAQPRADHAVVMSAQAARPPAIVDHRHVDKSESQSEQADLSGSPVSSASHGPAMVSANRAAPPPAAASAALSSAPGAESSADRAPAADAVPSASLAMLTSMQHGAVAPESEAAPESSAAVTAPASDGVSPGQLATDTQLSQLQPHASGHLAPDAALQAGVCNMTPTAEQHCPAWHHSPAEGFGGRRVRQQQSHEGVPVEPGEARSAGNGASSSQSAAAVDAAHSRPDRASRGVGTRTLADQQRVTSGEQMPAWAQAMQAHAARMTEAVLAVRAQSCGLCVLTGKISIVILYVLSYSIPARAKVQHSTTTGAWHECIL